MLTREEANVLTYLKQHHHARTTYLTRTCGTGSWAEGLAQVISQLDWLGYVTVFCGPGGEPSLLQITERGCTTGAPLAAKPLRPMICVAAAFTDRANIPWFLDEGTTLFPGTSILYS